MSCISSVSYQISHAGRSVGPIVPARGLRQGDPLYSYLFLICTEGLTALLHDFEQQKKIIGIKVARSAPPISHMFFADDSYIFYKADADSADHVLQVLKNYENASGQQINFEKSSAFFSKNVATVLRNDLCRQLRLKEASDKSTYLGLPNIIGRNKSSLFGYLKEKMQDRIEGWDKKTLSKGGKEILLKTVAQTLPNYAMSVFLLPVTLCQDLEKLMCRYWWKSDSKKDKCIHWLSLGNMCKRKSAGGMGFRSLHDFNIALLGNQGWRLLTYPDRLVSRVFKARYYPQGSFLNATLGRNPSFIWRSVLESQPILKQGVGCRIGNGASIKILEDPWLPSYSDPYVYTSSAVLQNQMVSSLLDVDSGQWDVDLVLDVFESRDANLILSIPLNNEVNDSWYWRREKLGNYSVKSAYLLLQENKSSNDTQANSGFWRTLWNLKIPPKVMNFLWRASANCLPTKDMLRVKRVQVNDTCPSCNVCSETVLHAIVSCSYAVSCWEKLSILSISGDYFSFAEWLQLVFQQQRREEIQIIVIVCWMLWKSRNELVWNQHSLEPSEVVESAFSVLNQWKSVQDRTFDRFMGYMTHEDGVEHWQPPVINSVKVNTDAAIFEDLNCFSHAIVIRNHDGVLVEARSKCMRGNPSPELAEAIGIREALSWVKESEQADVVIESDCLQVQAI